MEVLLSSELTLKFALKCSIQYATKYLYQMNISYSAHYLYWFLHLTSSNYLHMEVKLCREIEHCWDSFTKMMA